MEYTSCNLCGQNNAKLIYKLPDWQTGREGVVATLVKCQNCGLVYQNPCPTEAELADLYPDTYECYQPEMDPGQLSWIRRIAASYGMNKRAKLVLAERKSGRLLDVGCATGVFLKAMQSFKNWELHGVELNDAAANIAHQKTGVGIICGTLESAHYPDNFFDVITLWDVFEHVQNASATLREINRVLKPGGALIARVPNGASWDARIFGQYWAGYEPPRHIYVFDSKTVKGLVEKSGMQLKRVGCNFGGYLTFLLSFQFVLSGRKTKPKDRQRILSFLQFPLLRLVAAPLFWALSRNLRGPMIDFTAVKKP